MSLSDAHVDATSRIASTAFPGVAGDATLDLPPDAKSMTQDEISTHIRFMREALAMANMALKTNETPVGCVLVDPVRKNIVARGMNATNASYNGTRHAEFIAINDLLSGCQIAGVNMEKSPVGEDSAGEKRQESGVRYGPETMKDLDLYVTVEPCIMCASLLRQFGIRKVWFGAANDKFGGTGGVLKVHERNGADAGESRDGEGGEEEGLDHRDKRRKGDEGATEEGDYEVSGGWLREEAIVALRRFYVQENERAPEPRNKKERVLKLEVEPMLASKTIGDDSGMT